MNKACSQTSAGSGAEKQEGTCGVKSQGVLGRYMQGKGLGRAQSVWGCAGFLVFLFHGSVLELFGNGYYKALHHTPSPSLSMPPTG